MPAGSTSRHGPPSYSRLFTLSFLFILSILLRPASARPKNYTIDDQQDYLIGQAPIYAPASAWALQNCHGCRIDPDPSQLFNGTATSATFMPDKNISSNTLDFDFNGTAVYIFFTLFYNEGDGVTVNTECNFTVDSEPAVFFNHTGDPTKPPNQVRDYRALVFSRTGLTLGPHHMRVSMSDVSYHVFLSFDYAMYTNEELDAPVVPPSTSNSSATTSSTFPPAEATTNTRATVQTSGSLDSSSPVSPGIIAGGVIGGVAVLAGFLVLFYFYRRDRKRYQSPDSPGPTVPRPFTAIVLSNRSGDSQTRPSLSTNAATNSSRAASRNNSQNGRALTTPAPSSRSNQNSRRGPSMETSTSSQPMTRSSGSVGSSSRSGSRSVEHQIQMASQRMRSLRAEMASVSGRTALSSRSSGSRTSSSRATEELAEEVKQLRQEIQALKQLQRQQAQAQQLQSAVDFGPPPLYTDEVAREV